MDICYCALLLLILFVVHSHQEEDVSVLSNLTSVDIISLQNDTTTSRNLKKSFDDSLNRTDNSIFPLVSSLPPAAVTLNSSQHGTQSQYPEGNETFPHLFARLTDKNMTSNIYVNNNTLLLNSSHILEIQDTFLGKQNESVETAENVINVNASQTNQTIDQNLSVPYMNHANSTGDLGNLDFTQTGSEMTYIIPTANNYSSDPSKPSDLIKAKSTNSTMDNMPAVTPAKDLSIFTDMDTAIYSSNTKKTSSNDVSPSEVSRNYVTEVMKHSYVAKSNDMSTISPAVSFISPPTSPKNVSHPSFYQQYGHQGKAKTRAYPPHAIHGLIWEDHDYMLRVLFPIGCGIIGAMGIILITYLCRNCNKDVFLSKLMSAGDNTNASCNAHLDKVLLLDNSSDEETG